MEKIKNNILSTYIISHSIAFSQTVFLLTNLSLKKGDTKVQSHEKREGGFTTKLRCNNCGCILSPFDSIRYK